MGDVSYVVGTERLGGPGAESGRWERAGIFQGKLQYPTDLDMPTATCHVQPSREEKALCGLPWEALIEVPGQPSFEDIEISLRCDRCRRLLEASEKSPFMHDVGALIERLANELENQASVRRGPPCWHLDPANVLASPLWVCGEGDRDLTVGFGRAAARIELGYGKTSASDLLGELEPIIRAVIEGRLTEKRHRDTGSRWRLVLGDGRTFKGWSNFLFPWSRVEHFHSYDSAP
jgi:hypothetical protein